MQLKLKKTVSVVLLLTMLTVLLSSCSFDKILNKDVQEPVAVKVKTDLKDAVFTFTYGELKGVLPQDKLGSLFESYDKLSDDITIDMTYNDIASRYDEGSELFDSVMALLSEEEKAQLKNNAEDVLNYFVEKINDAKAQKPIVEYKESFWTDKNSIEFTQNGAESDSKLVSAAKYFNYFVTKGVGSYLDNEENGKKGTTEKGDDLTNILYLYGEKDACRLTIDDVSAVYSSVAYETAKNSKDEDVPIGATRVVKIVLKNDEKSVKNAFSLRGKDNILDEMKKSADYFTVNDYDVAFDACTIVVTFNAVTDNIITATYNKNMNVSTVVNGVGSLEYLGSQDLSFNCTDCVEYHFGWEAEAK